MKIKMYALFGLLAFNAYAGQDRGGGDMCENRIKIIRDDLNEWIIKGGADDLDFSSDTTLEQYKTKMLKEISNAKIKCVSEKDPGYPVEINGTPKDCRFDKNSKASYITCDSEKFSKLSDSDQYVLIHHEYAGLARIEIPNRDDSNYNVSNQISEYLEETIIKKLAVKKVEEKAPPVLTAGNYGNRNQYCGFTLFNNPIPGEKEIFIKYINNPGRPDLACSWNGITEAWTYEEGFGGHVKRRNSLTCILSTLPGGGSIQQTCYLGNTLKSVDTYYRY